MQHNTFDVAMTADGANQCICSIIAMAWFSLIWGSNDILLSFSSSLGLQEGVLATFSRCAHLFGSDCMIVLVAVSAHKTGMKGSSSNLLM
jgi:hypothetical protein